MQLGLLLSRLRIRPGCILWCQSLRFVARRLRVPGLPPENTGLSRRRCIHYKTLSRSEGTCEGLEYCGTGLARVFLAAPPLRPLLEGTRTPATAFHSPIRQRLNSKLGSVAEWSIAPVLKTGDGKLSVSSNLTASAKQQPPTAHALGGFFVPARSLAGQEILDLPDSLNAVGFGTNPRSVFKEFRP